MFAGPLKKAKILRYAIYRVYRSANDYEDLNIHVAEVMEAIEDGMTNEVIEIDEIEDDFKELELIYYAAKLDENEDVLRRIENYIDSLEHSSLTGVLDAFKTRVLGATDNDIQEIARSLPPPEE